MSELRKTKSGHEITRTLLLIVLCLACTLLSRAQSTYGSLTGTVVDSSGAMTPGVTVTLINTATSEKQTQVTGDTGLYSFVNLNPGVYRMTAEKNGFKRLSRENIAIQVQQTARVDLTLAIGTASETVTVTSDVPLLQPETSSLGQVVEERNADELPLNGRNVFSLVEVAPSVVMQGQAGATATGQNPFAWGNFQIGGAFANQSAEYLDGQPLNIGYINLPILIPTQDSIGEFKVQTNNIGPEWGKVAGGVLNLSTKSGSNTFHGEAYEYIRNKVLNANDFFSNHAGLARPPWIQNQFGGNVGGRIWKDRTFFFYGFEGFRLRSSASWVSTVPTADLQSAVKNGTDVNLTNLLAANGLSRIVDPCGGILQTTPNANGLGVGGCAINPATGLALGTSTPFANATIPAARVNATAKALMDLWPAPTTADQLNNYTSSYSLGGNQNQNIARIDQKINDKQHLFGRFSQWNNLNQPEDPLGTGLCLDRCTETMTSKGIALGYNYVFSPTLIGNLDVSATRFNYARTPKNSGFDFTKIGWNSAFNSELSSSERTPPTIGVVGESDNVMATQGQSYIVDHDTQYWISPTLTLVRGRHTIQVGYQDEITMDDYAQSNIISGYLGFDGTYTGNPGFGMADYLLGWATNPEQVGNHFYGTAVIPNLVAGKQKMLAGFANDTWHATGKLTLNLGVRYEYQSPWSERYNRQSYFDPTAIDPIASAAVGTVGGPTTAPLGSVGLVASSTRSSRYNLEENKLGVGPRVGFAYSLDSKTVLRGGYGLFWIPLDASWATNPLNDPVNSIQTEYTGNNGNINLPTNTITTPWINFIQPPGASRTATGLPVVAVDLEGATSPTFENPNYNYGYMQQWNFDIQRTLPGGWFADIAYAANKGTHLPVYNQQIAQLGDNYLAQAAAQVASGAATVCSATVTAPAGEACIAQSVANPFAATSAPGSALSSSTTTMGQLVRPFPQYNGLQYAGAGNFASTYNSLQATLQKRFNGGGTVLASYTWAKLLSNTDTITSWLEPGGKGGVQDWNNLRAEKSLSSQNVPQHLIVSYVLDLPFGNNHKYANSLNPLANKVIGGWGLDGVTTFQNGFPINIGSGGNGVNYYGGGLRPNVVAGCKKATSGSGATRVLSGLNGNAGWINPACFTTPAPYTWGNEPRVDPSLQASGIDNWDFAVFKHTTFGPDQKLGFEFRCEIFNTFNRVQFAPPSNTTGSTNFGVISGEGQMNNPRLVQFAGKIVF